MSENLSYLFCIVRDAITSCEGVDILHTFSVERILNRISDRNLSSKVRSYSDTRIFLQVFNVFSSSYYFQIALSQNQEEAYFVLNNHFFPLPNEEAAIAVLEALYGDTFLLEIQKRHAEHEKCRIKNERLARLKQMFRESIKG